MSYRAVGKQIQLAGDLIAGGQNKPNSNELFQALGVRFFLFTYLRYLPYSPMS